jgi:hypothetical protein
MRQLRYLFRPRFALTPLVVTKDRCQFPETGSSTIYKNVYVFGLRVYTSRDAYRDHCIPRTHGETVSWLDDAEESAGD